MDALSRRPDLEPEETTELVIVLPDHLFVDPTMPTTALTTTRVKKTLLPPSREPGPHDDSQYVTKELTLETLPLKQPMKAHMAQMESLRSTAQLDDLVLQAQVIDEATMLRWQ